MKRSAVLVALASSLAPLGAQETPRYLAAGTPIEGDVLVFLAQSEGYFARAGVEVEVRAMSSGDAIAAAIVAGELALGSMNVVSLALAHQNGIPLHIVAPGAVYDSSVPGSQLMVRKDAPYRSAADLNGKTIAVNVLKGSAYLTAQAWVDRNGGDAKSVRWVEVPFSAMAAALEAGRIDAASIAEPAATAARATCRSLGAPNDAVGRTYLISAYVTSDSWLERHRDAARRIRAALRSAAIWYDANHAQSVAAVAALTKQDPAVVAKSIRSIFGQTLEPGLVQPMVDVAARYGILSHSFPAAELIARI
jgi:NitT/TauT family transport system substrate-binding protein